MSRPVTVRPRKSCDGFIRSDENTMRCQLKVFIFDKTNGLAGEEPASGRRDENGPM